MGLLAARKCFKARKQQERLFPGRATVLRQCLKRCTDIRSL